MTKSMFANSRIKVLALLTAAFSLATLDVKAFAAEPLRPTAPDPYPLTDTLMWKFAGAEVRWYVKKPGGITLVTHDRNGQMDAVPEYRLVNWKPGLIDKLPIPKRPSELPSTRMRRISCSKNFPS